MAQDLSKKSESFGFEHQMAQADWSAFPRWYQARCLLNTGRTVSTRNPTLPQQFDPVEMEPLKRAA